MDEQSEKDLGELEKTLQSVKESIIKVQKDDAKISDCFVSAQTFDNQKRYMRDLYEEDPDPEILKKVDELEQAAQEEYKKMFSVYDRLSDKEVIDDLHMELEKLYEDYAEKMNYIGEVSDDKLIAILEARDRIKIVFDEMEMWLDRFTEADQRAYERKNELFEKIKKRDDKLQNELVVKSQFHQRIYDTAREKLIKPPKGSERFNFWWWHIGR
ncbi:hypothetical protein KKH43_04130 [Patescibacteria group bacterium]|nr:hypothetical protein [Patescibacteria group bacterium]